VRRRISFMGLLSFWTSAFDNRYVDVFLLLFNFTIITVCLKKPDSSS